jgi:hypothetical protein
MGSVESTKGDEAITPAGTRPCRHETLTVSTALTLSG